MSTTLLQHTQKIRGFQHRKYEYTTKNLIWVIKRKEFRCPKCGSLKITRECRRERLVQGVPMGRLLVYFRIKVHRLYCANCHRRNLEFFHFLSSPNSRITKGLEQRILNDRHEMSIRSVAEKYRLRWELVKEIEKRYLGRKYARVQAAHVRRIGIDEIHTGSNPDRSQRYLTVVRDLKSGAMLEAVDKYDPARKPGNFRGYAAGVIANALRMRCWEGDRLIMVPARAIRSMFRIYMATEKLEKQLNRAPTDQELSAETKLSLRIIRNRRQIPFGTNSLDEVIPGTGASGKSLADDADMPRTLGDMIPAPQNEENRPVRRPGSQITSHDERVVLRWALRRLKKYQSLVIKYKFNLDRRNRSTGLSLRELTTAEICRLLKITRSLLRKTYYASIRDLRRMMVEKFLLEFGVQPVSGKVLEKVIQRERLAEMAGRI